MNTRSRLALLWQSASEADFYGSDEITALQVRQASRMYQVLALEVGSPML